MLHDHVVAMGVDADVLCLLEGEVKHCFQDALGALLAGNAMDDSVRLVVEPLSLVDLRISDIGTGYQCESGDGFPALFHHITDALADILTEDVGRGVTICPLLLVTTLAHLLFGLFGYLQQCGDVVDGRFANQLCLVFFDVTYDIVDGSHGVAVAMTEEVQNVANTLLFFYLLVDKLVYEVDGGTVVLLVGHISQFVDF